MATSQFGPYASIVRAAGQIPAPATYARPKKHHHGGSLLGNLLSDTVDTAKGIPSGVIQTFEHPVRSAENIGHSYAHLYGPLFHGHFGTFWHNVEAHPLQPLLDAVSVVSTIATLGAAAPLAGGLEGVSSAADIGRIAELARAGKLSEASGLGSRVRALPTSLTEQTGYHEVHVFSKKLFTRALQKGAGAIVEKAAKTPLRTVGEDQAFLPIIGKGGSFDMTALGKGDRALARTLSRRESGFHATALQEARFLHQAGIKEGFGAKEITETLFPHVDKSMVDNALWVPEETAQKLVGSKAAKRFKYLTPKKRDIGHEFDPQNMDSMRAWLSEKLPKRWVLSRDPANALRSEDGKLVAIVRKEVPKEMSNEVENTARALHALYRSPLKVWKWAILAQAPRYFVNNTVGNTVMLAAATHPGALFRGIHDAIRTTRGNAAAERFLRQNGHILEAIAAKNFPHDFVNSHFGYLGHGTLGLEKTVGVGRHPIHTGARGGFYGVTEKVAYRATQSVGLHVALRRLKPFRDSVKLFKQQGLKGDAAFQAAAKLVLRDHNIRAIVEKDVADWAGQYYHLNSAEHMVTAFVPFYTWTRHALRFGKTQVMERPGASSVLARIGTEGGTYNQKKLGNLPDFLKGAIPVHGAAGGVLGAVLGGDIRGRKKVILSESLNPLAAASEDARAITALASNPRNSREALATQLSPLISGALSDLTGTDMLTGARVHSHGGLVGASLGAAFGSIPVAKVVRALMHPPTGKTKSGQPTLYTHDLRQQLSSWLGLSERDFSPKAATRLYNEEHGIKKSRKKHKAQPQPYMPYGYAKYLKSPY